VVLPKDRGFQTPPSPNLPGLRLRPIVSGVPAHVGALLGQFAKLLGVGCVLALVLPALLIVTVLSLLLARLFGVPLFAAPTSARREG